MVILDNHVFLLSTLLWAIGGVTALTVIARKEQRRLGGNLFARMSEEIADLPFPATLGYTLTFTCSWLSVLYHLLFERE